MQILVSCCSATPHIRSWCLAAQQHSTSDLVIVLRSNTLYQIVLPCCAATLRIRSWCLAAQQHTASDVFFVLRSNTPHRMFFSCCSTLRIRSWCRAACIRGVWCPQSESQGSILALTVLYVPHSVWWTAEGGSNLEKHVRSNLCTRPSLPTSLIRNRPPP